jgi:hypothetical protein
MLISNHFKTEFSEIKKLLWTAEKLLQSTIVIFFISEKHRIMVFPQKVKKKSLYIVPLWASWEQESYITHGLPNIAPLRCKQLKLS